MENSRRFVVLHHVESSGEHYDLMIEQGGLLATWKFSHPPEHATTAPADCIRIGDHRALYLTYEGPVPAPGSSHPVPSRGRVSRHDEGSCRIVTTNVDHWQIEFAGRKLRGRFELSPKPVQPGDAAGQSWSFRRLPV